MWPGFPGRWPCANGPAARRLRLRDDDIVVFIRAHFGMEDADGGEWVVKGDALPTVEPDLREVASLFHCSRRMAEIRFRATTGHSILDEIHAVQIEHAKNLLANPYVKLTVIPQMCGYGSNAFFMGLFRRITGLTMRQWRRTGGAATSGGGPARRGK